MALMHQPAECSDAALQAMQATLAVIDDHLLVEQMVWTIAHRRYDREIRQRIPAFAKIFEGAAANNARLHGFLLEQAATLNKRFTEATNLNERHPDIDWGLHMSFKRPEETCGELLARMPELARQAAAEQVVVRWAPQTTSVICSGALDLERNEMTPPLHLQFAYAGRTRGLRPDEECLAVSAQLRRGLENPPHRADEKIRVQPDDSTGGR